MKSKKMAIMLSLMGILVITLTACSKSLQEDLTANNWYFTLDDEPNLTIDLEFTEDKIHVDIGLLKINMDYKVLDENTLEAIESGDVKTNWYFEKIDTGYDVVVEYLNSGATHNGTIVRRNPTNK